MKDKTRMRRQPCLEQLVTVRQKERREREMERLNEG